MFNKRWYDQDPLLSMAVSLLQNTEPTNQAQVTKSILNELQDNSVRFEKPVFTRIDHCIALMFHRRQKIDQNAWYLLEVIKLLSFEQRRDIALQIINHIYEMENLDKAMLAHELEQVPHSTYAC